MKKQIVVKLEKSLINTKPNHRLCIRGLGLKKRGDERVLPNTSSVRGMIKKTLHLLSVVEK